MMVHLSSVPLLTDGSLKQLHKMICRPKDSDRIRSTNSPDPFSFVSNYPPKTPAATSLTKFKHHLRGSDPSCLLATTVQPKSPSTRKLLIYGPLRYPLVEALRPMFVLRAHLPENLNSLKGCLALSTKPLPHLLRLCLYLSHSYSQSCSHSRRCMNQSRNQCYSNNSGNQSHNNNRNQYHSKSQSSPYWQEVRLLLTSQLCYKTDQKSNPLLKMKSARRLPELKPNPKTAIVLA